MRTPRFLAVASLAALGLCACRPAAAQDLTYTLVGVVFTDQATVSGYFDYNPTTNSVGSYDFTSSDGVADEFLGCHYSTGDYSNGSPGIFSPGYFLFTSSGASTNYHYIVFGVYGSASAPGVYVLQPGTIIPGGNGSGTRESAESQYLGNDLYASRTILAGSLLVTPAPEPSSFAAFAIGLLGLGALAMKAKKRLPA